MRCQKRNGLGDGRRPPVVSVTVAPNAGNGACAILCLPEIKNGFAVSFIKIIGGANAFVQLAPLPSAARTTRVLAVAFRRYPNPSPGPIFAKTGFFATGSFSRTPRASSFVARDLRATLTLNP